MLEVIETQPWAAIAAAVFLMIATRAFWSVMRTTAKRNRKDRLKSPLDADRNGPIR